MRFLKLITAATAVCASTTFAQSLDTPLVCGGSAPDWSLAITGDVAEFEFVRQSNMTLALTTTAQGAEWPRALTLVGRGDSAIVILENMMCETGTLTARILTQRGETPVFLTGCCQPSPE